MADTLKLGFLGFPRMQCASLQAGEAAQIMVEFVSDGSFKVRTALSNLDLLEFKMSGQLLFLLVMQVLHPLLCMSHGLH